LDSDEDVEKNYNNDKINNLNNKESFNNIKNNENNKLNNKESFNNINSNNNYLNNNNNNKNINEKEKELNVEVFDFTENNENNKLNNNDSFNNNINSYNNNLNNNDNLINNKNNENKNEDLVFNDKINILNKNKENNNKNTDNKNNNEKKNKDDKNNNENKKNEKICEFNYDTRNKECLHCLKKEIVIKEDIKEKKKVEKKLTIKEIKEKIKLLLEKDLDDDKFLKFFYKREKEKKFEMIDEIIDEKEINNFDEDKIKKKILIDDDNIKENNINEILIDDKKDNLDSVENIVESFMNNIRKDDKEYEINKKIEIINKEILNIQNKNISNEKNNSNEKIINNNEKFIENNSKVYSKENNNNEKLITKQSKDQNKEIVYQNKKELENKEFKNKEYSIEEEFIQNQFKFFNIFSKTDTIDILSLKYFSIFYKFELLIKFDKDYEYVDDKKEYFKRIFDYIFEFFKKKEFDNFWRAYKDVFGNDEFGLEFFNNMKNYILKNIFQENLKIDLFKKLNFYANTYYNSEKENKYEKSKNEKENKNTPNNLKNINEDNKNKEESKKEIKSKISKEKLNKLKSIINTNEKIFEENLEIINENLKENYVSVMDIEDIKEINYNDFILTNYKYLNYLNNNEKNILLQYFKEGKKLLRKIVKYIIYSINKKNIIIYIIKILKDEENEIKEYKEYFFEKIKELNNNENKQLIKNIKNINDEIKAKLKKTEEIYILEEKKFFILNKLLKIKMNIENYYFNNKDINLLNEKIEDLKDLNFEFKEDKKEILDFEIYYNNIKNNKNEIKNYKKLLNEFQYFNFYFDKNKNILNKLIDENDLKNYNTDVKKKTILLEKIYYFLEEIDNLENDILKIRNILNKEEINNINKDLITKKLGELENLMNNKSINKNFDVDMLKKEKRLKLFEIMSYLYGDEKEILIQTEKKYYKIKDYDFDIFKEDINFLKHNNDISILKVNKKNYIISFTIGLNINLFLLYINEKGIRLELKNEKNDITKKFIEIYENIYDKFDIFKMLYVIINEIEICSIIYNEENLYQNQILVDKDNNIIAQVIEGIFVKYKKNGKYYIEDKFIQSTGIFFFNNIRM
jgi:hypothetical protein